MKRWWHSNEPKPWMGRVLTIVVAVCLLAWLGSLALVYGGDEYASPAWDEHSVPPPRTY